MTFYFICKDISYFLIQNFVQVFARPKSANIFILAEDLKEKNSLHTHTQFVLKMIIYKC